MKIRKSGMHRAPAFAKNAGEFLVGNDLCVARLGLSAMRMWCQQGVKDV